MFHKVINCSSLQHIKLQHLSLMLFSFMVCHKRSPKPTTIHHRFTWDVPRAFEVFLLFLESKGYHPHRRVLYNRVKPKSSGFSVQVTTAGSARGWQQGSRATRQQRWLWPEAAWSLLLVSCPPGRPSLLLEGGEMSQASECYVHAAALLINLSSVVVAAWRKGCSQPTGGEPDPLFFL